MIFKHSSPFVLALVVVFFAGFFAGCGFSVKDHGCDEFKTGTFRYRFKGQDYQTDFLIRRSDSIQTETDLKSGLSSRFAIRWTGPCSYELWLLESSFPYPDSISRLRKALPTKTEILGQTRDYYLFRTSRDQSDFVLTDTLWIEHQPVAE